MALRGTAFVCSTSSVSSATVSVSSIGIQAGDVVLLMAVNGGSTTQTFTYPAGFAAVPNCPNMPCGGGTVGIAYKIAAAGEPTSYSVTPSKSDFLALAVRVYSGRGVNPFSASINTNALPNQTSPITYALNGVTATSGDDVVAMVANRPYIDNAPTFTAPSGYANTQLNYTGTTYAQIMVGFDAVNAASGPTGKIGGAYTVGARADCVYAGYVMSLSTPAVNAPIPSGSRQMFVTENHLQF